MSHTAELIAVGTELLLGNIANTDAQMISEGLSQLGINVYYHTVVGDNPERVRQAVDIARQRADILITTGGLGPTCDDLTKVAVAQAFGRTLVYHEPSAQRIRDRFAAMGRPVTENNFQQAMIPEGATVLDNDWGTAPGVAFEADGVRVIMLPGPPRECRAMFTHRVIPCLKSLADGVIVSRTLKLFGIGEESTLHFDAVAAGLVEKNLDAYSACEDWDDEFELAWQGDLEKVDSLETDMATRVAMMNPLYWLSGHYEGYGQASVAPHWRINEGLFDTDAALVTAPNIVLALRKYDGVADVAHTPVWGQGHVLAERSGSATTNLIAWVTSCCDQ